MDNKQRIKLVGFLLCVLVAIGALLLLIFPASDSDAGAKPPEMEGQMLLLINQARREAGALPLEWDARAAKVAAAKVAEMAKEDYFAHISPNTGDLDQQFAKWGNLVLGENVAGIGENLAQAQGYSDEELTPLFWHEGSMNSPEHRKNVINPQFTHIGIAVKRGSDGKVFMAQMFMMAAEAASPSPSPQNAGNMELFPSPSPVSEAPVALLGE